MRINSILEQVTKRKYPAALGCHLSQEFTQNSNILVSAAINSLTPSALSF